MNNKEHIARLTSEIKEHNRLYRLGTPDIPDSEYDKKVEELRLLDPDNDWFKTIEPATVADKYKRKLPIPMKSLNKVKTTREIMQWAQNLGLPENTKLVIMPKYDGVSWLHSETTHRTYSRGGSENEGMDCSRHFNEGCFLESNNLQFKHTFGELVFSTSAWETHFVGEVSETTGEPYKSPRNTIAGLINRDKPSSLMRYASFVRYGADEHSLHSGPWTTFSGFLEDLNSTFHQEKNYQVVSLKQLEGAALNELFQEWRSHYYIDGLVIYIDELLYWQAVGRQQTSGNPLYAIAYKSPDFTDAFESCVKGVEWNVSKSGALKPVVLIDAVDTGDCIMQSPTGNNYRWVFERNIAAGATVLVTRSGGVIPKILGTLTPADYADLELQRQSLQTCPVCGAPTKCDEKGIELYCTNPDCAGRQIAKIIHFFKTVGVEQIGEETVRTLYSEGFTSVKAILDITREQILEIDGFGDGTASIIVKEMNKIKNGVELPILMHASDCFKGIGVVKAKAFIGAMSKDVLDDFCNGRYITKPVDEESSEVKVLPVTLQSFVLGYFPFMSFVKEAGLPIIIPQAKATTSDRYKGVAVCFSGVRDKELEQAIEAGGGTIMTGVTGRTTHLIVKDVNASTGKIAKAQLLKIPIISIEDFKAL